MNDKQKLMTLGEAANACPKRTSANSLWRWARRGLKARNGERIHLRHLRVGGMIFIPADGLEEFFNALATADIEHFDKPNTPEPTPAKNKGGARSAHQQAKALLAARGL